jgi:hypothetical protein
MATTRGNRAGSRSPVSPASSAILSPEESLTQMKINSSQKILCKYSFSTPRSSHRANHADQPLYVHAERRLAANCDAAAHAVIEALCDAVAHRVKRSVTAAADMTEFVLPGLTKRERDASAPPAPRFTSRSRKT